MTGPEHYARAEEAMSDIGEMMVEVLGALNTRSSVTSLSASVGAIGLALQLAQAHIALAHVAAIVDSSDTLGDNAPEWLRVTT
jgi:hypothetical protein